MKKLLYLLALLLPLAGFTQNTRAFYGSSISRSYGVDTLAGFKAVNTNTLGYAGLVAISAADTSAFFTNGTGHASIYNSAGVLRQPQYVGVGGSPDVSGTAYLSLTGTTGGFLTARMTAAQKNAIGSPATGLLIYQTDGTPGFYYYNGSAWSAVGGASGLVPGTTAISPTVTGSVLMDIGGTVTESNSYRAQQATPAGTAFGYNASYGAGIDSYGTVVGNTVYGYEASPSMNITGRNTFIGYRAGYAYTTGSSGFGGNTFVGWSAGVSNSNSLATTLIGAAISCANYSASVGIGYACTVGGDQTIVIGQASALGYSVSIGHEAAAWGNYNASIGYQAGKTNTGSYNTFLNTGQFSSSTISYSIGVGYSAKPTANHQAVFGGNHANGYINDVYFNGVTHSAPYPAALRGSGGSGTDVSGAVLSLIPGVGTGSSTTNGYLSVSTCPTALGSGTTSQTVTEVVRITKTGDILMLNAANGLILKDAAGTPHYWRVTIDAVGAIVTTDLGTTIPN